MFMSQLRAINFGLAMLLVGFLLGWIAHHYWPASTVDKALAITAPTDSRPAILVQQGTPDSNTELVANPSPAAEQTMEQSSLTSSPVAVLRELLRQQHYERAVAYYDQVKDSDENLAARLHKVLMNYLAAALEAERLEPFMLLMDIYLASDYQDIDALILLAEYQRRQAYPEEAAKVFQLAYTYAYEITDREKLASALSNLIGKTDAQLADQQRWVELLSFYQFLLSIDLVLPPHLLRMATIYLQLDDQLSAVSLLRELAADTSIGAQAGALLAAIDKQDKPIAPVTKTESVALLRYRNHYIAPVLVNREAELSLIIDTGASITSLSKRRFDDMVDDGLVDDFRRVGVHLFNTANGMSRGVVYRVDQFRLGNNELNDIRIAVLDFDQETGIDGLLGMNVLQHFRFEIDQDESALLLQPR